VVSAANRAVLLHCVNLEREFRLSGRAQELFGQAGLDGWMDVCADEQCAIVQRVTSYTRQSSEGRLWVQALRSAHLLYPNEPLFKTLPVQVKHNRRTEGLPEGFFLDVPLVDLNPAAPRTATSLAAVVGHGPVVVVAGSVT